MIYNKSYHQFFEGFAEKRVTDPDTGRKYIRRIYADCYYRHRLDETNVRKVKIFYAAVFALALICFLMQGISRSAVVWYLIFPLMLGIIALVWLGFYVISYIGHPQRLMIRQYRQREMLKTLFMANAIVLVTCAAGQSAWMIAEGVFYPYGAFCIAADAASAFVLYRGFKTERDMEYIKVENTNQPDSESYDIRYYEE